MRRLPAWSKDLRGKAVLALIILGSLGGMLFGYLLTYYVQLSETSLAWWVFVPDCPLYVGLFAVLAYFSLFGIRSDLFGLLVSVGCMKYAAWTMFVLAFYGPQYYATPVLALESTLLFVMHVGMMLEGLTLPFRNVSRAGAALVLAWFLLNDLVDYFGPNLHPYLPAGAGVFPPMAFAFASTLFFTGAALYLWREGIRVRVPGLS
ncbi:MAG: DUF1405 domain-containing protein [Candidatus ainarchaeum sp.]|nr:DUF1405 domain-containing protein [Candidatus ainarchaeum sp.]